MATPNAKLAYAVLDHIDADPRLWLQGTWLTRTDCGTAGCFAGWTSLLSGDQPIWRGFGVASHVDTGVGQVYVANRAAQLLGFRNHSELAVAGYAGVDEDEDSDVDWDLFDATNNREDLGRIVEKVFGPRPDGES